MGTIGLFTLVTLVVTAQCSVWSPGKSYTYQFNGWAATGIPQIEHQYSGIHLSGRLVVEPTSKNSIVFALKETVARKFNQEIDRTVLAYPKKWMEIGDVVEVMDKEVLEKPSEVTFKGDEFESLSFSGNEPLWVVNFKKGLAAQLQIQISGDKGSKGAFERLQLEEKTTFPVMENSITGECEVWYELSEMPEERVKSQPFLVPSSEFCKEGVFYEIIKTVNFDRCIKSSIMSNVSPFAWKCVPGVNKCGTSKMRSLTVRTTGCGSSRGDFVVQHQGTIDVEAVKPFGSDTEPIEAMNYITINLESVEHQKSLSEPRGEKVYSLMYAHSKEQINGGLMAQPKLKDPIVRRHPSDRILVKEIRRLMVEVIRDLESTEFLLTPEKLGISAKIAMIRKAASFLPYQELKSVFQKELSMEEETTQHQIAMNILTNAGTNAAILLIKEQILEGRVTGERRSQSISILPITLKTPTVDILSELVGLLESKVAKEDEIFEATLALSISNIIYQACVNKTLSRRLYPTLVMGDFCSPNEPLIVKTLIPYFAEKIESSKSTFEKMAFLTALGNLGHEGILPVLASVVECEEGLEHSLRRWHTKHGLPSEFSAYKKGAKRSHELDKEDIEELAELSRFKQGAWSKKYFEDLVLGKKTKRSLRAFYENEYSKYPRREEEEEEEEEEELEISESLRKRHGIPRHEKITINTLKKYNIPKDKVIRSESQRLFEDEEEDVEIPHEVRHKFGIPAHEKKINAGVLRKYGVPAEEIERLSKKNRGIRSYFDDELEEEDEYELTPAQRRQFSIPSHVEKVNEGILRKYGVPSQEAKRLEKRLRSSGIRSYVDDELEDDEEYELTPAQRRQYSVPSHVEKVNKGILRKYGVPSEEAKRLEKRLRNAESRFELEEEEYELSELERMKYGVPIGERISGKTLKKYNVPLEVAEIIRGYGSRRTGGTLSSTKGGKKHRHHGKSRKGKGRGGRRSEETEFEILPRVKAVAALKRLAFGHNPKTIHLLGSIFFNTNEDPEVRIAALNLLFRSDAPTLMWERIAVGTWIDPSYQVQHYVFTSLNSIATIENPTHRSCMKKARAVLPLVKPMRVSATGSSHYVGSYYDIDEDTGYYTEAGSLFTDSSPFPIKTFLDIGVKEGHFDFSVSKFSIMGEETTEKSISSLIPSLMKPSDETSAHSELRELRDFLDIERRSSRKSPVGVIHMKLMEGLERMWPLRADMFSKLSSHFSKYLKSGKGSDINYRSWSSFGDIYASVPMAMGIPLSVDTHWLSLNTIVGNVAVSSKEIEAEITGSYGWQVFSKLSYDVPFVNKIVSSGVDLDTWIFLPLPGSMCIKGEPSQGKMTIEMEPMRGKISVLHFQVKPFTAVKDFEDFTPVNQVSDVKMVTKHKGPIEVNLPLSKKLFGVETDILGMKANILHKSDSKKLTSITTLNSIASIFSSGKIVNRLMGLMGNLRYRETKLVLDIPASETKAIKLDLEVAVAAQPVSEDVTVIRSGTRTEKSIRPSEREQVETIYGKLDESKLENLMSVFESTVGGQAMTVDASVTLIGIPTKKYEASITFGKGGLGLVQKGSIHIQPRSSGSKTPGSKTCIDAEINWPKLTSLERGYLLEADLATSFSISLGQGSNCENRKTYSIEGKMSQTYEQVAYAKSSPEAVLCKKLETERNIYVASEVCEEARKQASDLNMYEIEFDYPSMPSDTVKNITSQVENLLKYIGYRHLSENVNVKNEKHKIKVVAELEPIDRTKANIQFFTPRSNVFFNGVPLGWISRTVLPINIRLPLLPNMLNTVDICAIERSYVNTFDNTPYEAELTSCDHVLASDCTGKYEIAVLAREERGNKITTVIYNKDKIVMDPAAKKVTVNGNEHGFVEDKVVITVTESGLTNLVVHQVGGFLEVIVPSIGKVTTNSDKVFLMTFGFQRGRTCGMCGTGKDEQVGDLEGPNGCTLSTGRRLAAAYMLESPKGSCKVDRRTQEEFAEAKREQESCLKGEPYYKLAEALEEVGERATFGGVFGSIGTKEASECTTFRNKMTTKGGLTCFSVVAVPECRVGCKPMNKISKRIGFHCVPKGRLQEHLLGEYQERPLNELSGKEEHTYHVVEVPTACS